MAVEETSFTVTRLSISPTPLPINTPAKAVTWQHMLGTYQMVISAVSNKVRIQLKQGNVVKLNVMLNKLTPAQKKSPNAARLQYQDCRMSLRYPSSPNVDNGMTERFQLAFADPTTVRDIIKRLTPFFFVVAPSNTPAESQAAGPSSEPKATKKRKGTSDAEESQAAPPPAKKKKKEATLPFPAVACRGPESQAGSSGGSVNIESQAAMGKSRTPSDTPPAQPRPAQPVQPETAAAPRKDPSRPRSATPPVADPSIEALKAQLLRGYTSEATEQTQTESTTPPAPLSTRDSPPQIFPAPVLERSSSETLTAGPTAPPRPSYSDINSTTSIDQAEAEIDLLPRSPLVDTSSQPFIPPAQTQPGVLGKFTSLAELDFRLEETEADSLNCAFPPMRTAEEEAAERLRREMDDEEWKDGGVESDVSAELQMIWQNPNRPVGLAMINDWAAGATVTDDEIFARLDRGELNQNFLEICYRVAMAAYQPPALASSSETLLLLDGPLPSSPPLNATCQPLSSQLGLPSYDWPNNQPLSSSDNEYSYQSYPRDFSHSQTYTPRRQPQTQPAQQDRPLYPPSFYDQDRHDHYYSEDTYYNQQHSPFPLTRVQHVQQRYDDFDDIDE